MKRRIILMASLFGMLVSACSGPADISEYAGEKPELKIADYLNGDVEAWGIVEDYSGTVVSRFHVKMVGTWKKDGTGTLTEHFTYSDGSTQDRKWDLVKISDTEFTGTAPDVIGTMRGHSTGNAAAMAYVLEVPVKGRTWRFTMDDRMYRLNDTMLVNRAKMKKFGITLAEMTLFFVKK